MATKVTQKQLATALEVTPAVINRCMKAGKISSVGKLVDLQAFETKRYIREREQRNRKSYSTAIQALLDDPNEPAEKPKKLKTYSSKRKPTSKAKSKAEAKDKTVKELISEDVDIEEDEAEQEDLDYNNLDKWAQRKLVAQVLQLEIKNAQLKKDLIAFELVKKAFISPIEGLFVDLLGNFITTQGEDLFKYSKEEGVMKEDFKIKLKTFIGIYLSKTKKQMEDTLKGIELERKRLK